MGKSSLEEKERKLGNLENNYLRKEETERINKEKYDSLTIENNQLKKRLEIKEINNNGNIDRIHELVEENLKYKNTEKEQKIEIEKLKKNQEEKSEKIKELEKEILDERENIISKIREGTSKKKKSDQEQEKEPRSKSNEREREGRARDFRRRPENTPQYRSRSRGGNQEQDRDRDYRLIYRRETDYHDYE